MDVSYVRNLGLASYAYQETHHPEWIRHTATKEGKVLNNKQPKSTFVSYDHENMPISTFNKDDHRLIYEYHRVRVLLYYRVPDTCGSRRFQEDPLIRERSYIYVAQLGCVHEVLKA